MKQYFSLTQIGDTKFISVSTYKGNNGDIITVAQCVDVAKHDGYATETFHVFADFSKPIAHSCLAVQKNL